MTTLIYHKDVIAGDSLQFINAGSNALPLRGPKVFLNKDKTLAYGICGHYILEKERDKLEKWLEEQLLALVAGKDLKPLIKRGHGFHLVVMSRNGTYTINHGEATVRGTQINDTDYFVNGTGGDHAILTISMGGDAIEAVKEGKKRDPMSGCDIYAIKRSALKPHKEL